mmetsp:Transcript_74454/g.164451  ORF Transcript_74454/g.164451 Transcript_74454/m.164451 type:complete len:560 (+) Transcript_74454:114-1793(+)
MEDVSKASSPVQTLLESHQEQIKLELFRHRIDMERLISSNMKVMSEPDIAIPVTPRRQKSKPVISPQGDLQEFPFDNATCAPPEPAASFSPSQVLFCEDDSMGSKIASMEEEDAAAASAARKRRTEQMFRRMNSATQSEISTPATDKRFKLATVVRSSAFESTAAILIITNAIFIGVEIEISARFPNQGMPLAIQVIGFAYTAAFALELLMRVFVHGLGMFWRKQYLWNLLDLFVVLVSLWEVIVLVLEALVKDLSLNAGIGVISSLRIVRILRITRLIRNSGSTPGRAMKFLRALRTLIHSIAYTLKEVMWAGVFLLLIMYVFSLALTQGVVGHLASSNANDVNPAMIRYWGGIGSSMSTCFMAVTGGISWEVASDPLLEVSQIWWWLFVTYVGFTVFAVLNVMTGVFCQSAIQSAQHDHELFLQNMLAERDDHLKRIKNLFARLDKDGSGSLTLSELEDHLEDPAVQAYFASLELSITDVWSFFKLLESDEEQEISPDAFFEGCQRLKGFARSLDLAKLMHQTQLMAKKQVDFMNQTSESLEKITSKMPNDKESRER